MEERERRFTAGGVEGVLDRVTQHLLQDVAVPRLRPVVVEVSGAAGGPVRISVSPGSSASYEYAEDALGQRTGATNTIDASDPP